MSDSKPCNQPEGTPRLSPYLLDSDADAAIDCLTAAVGFTEDFRLPGADGRTLHAELCVRDAHVVPGNRGEDHRSRRELGATTQVVHVCVGDVDAHFERARSAGAKLVAAPADQFCGDRNDRALDPEGHEWVVSQSVRDVPPEELSPKG